MKLATPLALTGLALVAACAQPDQTVIVDQPDATCIADQFQQYVGQQSPQITVPAGTVVRHYRTGDPVTMDLNPTRLNFEYDRSGRLKAVSCG